MTFQYSLASDLHMDTGHHGTPLRDMPWRENIIIAGDLGNGLGNFGFIEKLKRKGHNIFAVDGNHEHYANKSSGRSLQETEDGFYRHLGNQPRQVRIRDDLYLIGCNGWYHVEDELHWKNYMNDSRHGALSAQTVNEAAARHANFIAAGLLSMPHDAKAIVVTHTAPCEESLDPKYAGSDGNPYYFNPFMTDVLRRFAPSIHVWHHGHSHAPVDVMFEGVRIITNPRGYPGEVSGFRPLPLEA